jgi:Phospholipase_D-nuclease N-terminal
MDFWESFWDFFWFMFWCYVFIAFLFALFSVFSDLFRDKELNGWVKAVWVIVLVFFPVISLLVYLIVRGTGMATRNQTRAALRQEAETAYIRSAAGVTSPSEEIAKARTLLDAGSLTPEEYELIKQRALNA